MIRWLVLLFAALLIGFIGIAIHQSSLEVIALILALLAIVLLMVAFIRFAFGGRPATVRRRSGRVHLPSIRRRRPVQGSYTEELHAAIFQDQSAEEV